MRNPLFLFPVGLFLVVGIAFISVHFGVMTMNEFLGKMKMLLFLLAPIGLFVGIFTIDHFKKKNRDEE